MGGELCCEGVEGCDSRVTVRMRPVADDQQLPHPRPIDPIGNRTAWCPGKSRLKAHLASLGPRVASGLRTVRASNVKPGLAVPLRATSQDK